jgi:hypothetical protein
MYFPPTNQACEIVLPGRFRDVVDLMGRFNPVGQVWGLFIVIVAPRNGES